MEHLCSILIYKLMQYIADTHAENNPWTGVDEWALKVPNFTRKSRAPSQLLTLRQEA